MARALSTGFPFVRVDLYSILERVVFGEMTWYPEGGLMRFTPEIHDLTLGSGVEASEVIELESTETACVESEMALSQLTDFSAFLPKPRRLTAQGGLRRGAFWPFVSERVGTVVPGITLDQTASPLVDPVSSFGKPRIWAKTPSLRPREFHVFISKLLIGFDLPKDFLCSSIQFAVPASGLRLPAVQFGENDVEVIS